MKLAVAPRPCVSCPYRRDVPSGVWDVLEYEKLRGYDDPQTSYAVFHCHQENTSGVDTACRGWLSVACESVAVRLAMLDGRITGDEVYAKPLVPLFDTGNEAADHGLRDIRNPGPAARQMMEKLLSAGAALGDTQ